MPFPYPCHVHPQLLKFCNQSVARFVVVFIALGPNGLMGDIYEHVGADPSIRSMQEKSKYKDASLPPAAFVCSG